MNRAAAATVRMTLQAAALASLLSGCILQTETPLIDDATSQLLLGKGPVALDLFQPDPAHPGQWYPAEAPHLTITAQGNHYLVPDPDHPDDPGQAFRMWLLPLDDAHFGVEVDDPAGPLYGIARRDGAAFNLAMLDCDALKAQEASADWVIFDGTDCHPRADRTDAAALLRALIPAMPDPSLRAVPAP